MPPQTLELTYVNSDFSQNPVPDNGSSSTDPYGWYASVGGNSPADTVSVVDHDSASNSIDQAAVISSPGGNYTSLGNSSEEVASTDWYQIDYSLDIAKLSNTLGGYNRFEIYVDLDDDGVRSSGDLRLAGFGLNSSFNVGSQTVGAYVTHSGSFTLTPAQQALMAGRPISIEFQRYGSGGSAFAVDNISLTATFCFARDTLIDTPEGEVPVQDLAVGSAVRTLDNGVSTLRWVGRRRLSAADLMLAPHLRPVRIPAGALGNDLPRTALTVSPQHRILLRSPIIRRMFNSSEVLLAAKHLVGFAGIDHVLPAEGVEYYHLLFDAHQIVFSNGAPSESLFTGPEAMRALSRDQRSEVLELFPELAGAEKRPSARTFASGRQGRALVKRHRKNAKHLVA